MSSAIVTETASQGPQGMPPNDVLYEVVDGQIRELPPMGVFAGLLAFKLAHYLEFFAQAKKLGMVVVEVLFRLAANMPQRRPDAAFVSFDRLPGAIDFDDDPPYLDAVPNLAIEVVSPSNTAIEIEQKLADYFHAGVELVWVVFPKQRRVYVHESSAKVSVLEENDELTGGKLLPGFRLSLKELFDAGKKPS